MSKQKKKLDCYVQIFKQIQKRVKNIVRNWSPRFSSEEMFQVENDTEQYIVDFKKHTTCYKSELTGMSCSHAIQFIWFL